MLWAELSRRISLSCLALIFSCSALNREEKSHTRQEYQKHIKQCQCIHIMRCREDRCAVNITIMKQFQSHLLSCKFYQKVLLHFSTSIYFSSECTYKKKTIPIPFILQFFQFPVLVFTNCQVLSPQPRKIKLLMKSRLLLWTKYTAYQECPLLQAKRGRSVARLENRYLLYLIFFFRKINNFQACI